MDSKIIEYFQCPITGLICSEPVLADDGYIYEKCALEEHLRYSKKSPMTRQDIKNFYTVYNIKSLIDEIIKNNPELKKNQHVKYICPDKNSLKEILRGNITDISVYDFFDWKLFSELGLDYKEKFFTLDINKIKYFIDKGINFDCPNEYKKYPLYYFCRYSTVDIFEYLHDRKTNFELVDGDKKTPLHTAIELKKIDIIKYLIQIGVNLEAEDSKKRRPIHYAIQFLDENSRNNIIKLLLEKNINIEAVDSNGNRPILSVFEYCKTNTELINLLLNKGVELNICNIYNKTPMYYACSYCTEEIILSLIEKNLSLVEPSYNQILPIEIIFKRANLLKNIIKYLFEKKIFLNFITKKNNTISHLVCKNCDDELIKYLVDNNFDLKLQNKKKRTPLYYICKRKTHLINLFLDKISLVTDINNKTELHYFIVNPSSTVEDIIQIINKIVSDEEEKKKYFKQMINYKILNNEKNLNKYVTCIVDGINTSHKIQVT